MGFQDYIRDTTRIIDGVKRPTSLLSKSWWSQAAESRKRQRQNFVKFIDYNKGIYNNKTVKMDRTKGGRKRKWTKSPFDFVTHRRKYQKISKPRAVRKRRTRNNKRGGGRVYGQKTVVNPGTFTYFKFKYKPARYYEIIKKLGAPITYKFNGTFGGANTQGAQNTNYLQNQGIINERAALISIFDKSARLYDETNAQWIQYGDTVNARHRKIMINSVTSTLNLTNQSPSNVFITLRLLMAKTTENSVISPVQEWSNGYTNQQLGLPADAMSINNVGAMPQQSKAFNQHYKVIKTVKLNMGPGDEKVVKANFKMNRMIDQGYVVNNFNYKGLTYMWMHTIHGVAGDNFNQLTVGTITTTPSKFVATFDNTYNCTLVNAFAKATFADNTFKAADIENGTTANPVFTIADAAGTVVNNNETTNFA